MFKTRLMTAAVLVAGFLVGLFSLSDMAWALLMLGIIVHGAWEWAGLSGFKLRQQVFYVLLMLSVGVCLLPGTGWQIFTGIQYHIRFWTILASTAFWLLLVPAWLLFKHTEKKKWLLGITGVLVLLSAWYAVISLREISPLLLLAVMATVWIADSAAYVFGKNFGRSKLAPEISPGKTWEGVAGALAMVSLYGLLLSISFNTSIWLIVGFWGITLMSIVGDLFESLLKRQAGMKDSGNLLPGHGGILDRIDGLLSTLPLVTFYIHFPLYYSAFYE